ncbi:LON peptidase substrate-binding domain-containing protein [Polynucleobacter sp. AP-Titi-500A-B4]|uniref:LON peptidase substrate-binding domain-containing protein n=1 Tax=Polynucleobacter sp. AP-Titi-500A-B4 TaxID=2576923 RepID=UPI001BFE1976|nr:LON peptidase substrate-binding domain-containing protein [Polynucleobacter sp. AP-Titi-500A-B4]QWE12060.1 LON peptidase substrate-binding domain-containing protein [Polynucleobacter sp. AP-Titi-500A-B4]
MNEINQIPKKIPLFPLGTVLFPDGVIALKIFEARYLDMIKQCLREKTEFGVISIMKNSDPIHEGLAPNFSNIGTLALIEDFDPVQPALYITKSFGTRRFRLLNSAQEPNGLWIGEIELLDQDPEMPIPHEHHGVAKLLDEIISVIQSEDLMGEAPFKKPFKMDDCGWVSNRLAELLPISLAQKNHLLGQTNPRIRLDLITEIIEDDGLKNLKIH